MNKTLLTLCLLGWAMVAFAQVHFDDVAIAKGILHKYGGPLGGGVSFIDFDNDGLDDITLATGAGDKIHFYRNNGINFTKLIAPIDLDAHTKQLLWVDFDNDGDYDFYTANFDTTNLLFENKGNLIFEDITEIAGLPKTGNNTYGACFGDFDRDGWLDLYYCDRVPFNTNENQHFLFKNNADGTFTDITENSQTRDGGKAPFCSAFIDYNNDKWPDIYTAHDKVSTPNVLLENNGDGTFTDVSIISNADVAMDAMCVTPGDYNNDGWTDIYITNTALFGSALLQNIGPAGGGQVKFGNTAQFAGVQFLGRTGWGSVFLDADNDSDLDLYVVAADYGDIGQPNAFYLNNGFGIFSEPDAGFNSDTTITHNTAIGDFNDDGFPDIFVVNIKPDFSNLWKNNGGDKNWIKIKLQGVFSNRDAIGSKIEIFSGGNYQSRYTLCGNGFLGQNSLTEIIGINIAEKADSIVITWPTGHVDKLFNINSGEKLTVVEGNSTNGEIFVDDDVTLVLPPSNAVFEANKTPIHIFPNPASTQISIETTDPEIQQYFILNSLGNILASFKKESTHTIVDVDYLSNGFYFLLAVDSQGNKKAVKWIKN